MESSNLPEMVRFWVKYRPSLPNLKQRTNKLAHDVALTLYWARTFPSAIDSIVSEFALVLDRQFQNAHSDWFLS